MGAFAYHSNWLERAYTGVPLGEMLQWSDLIVSLYVLGHNVTISAERQTMNRYDSVPIVAPAVTVIYFSFFLLFFFIVVFIIVSVSP